ncbi:MAG: AraC family transcriptional regulator ligand-binding domain-containing protein, partial [Nocardioides sp.]
MSLTRSASLHGFADLVTELGGDPERLVLAAGLPREVLTSAEVRVPLETVAGVLEVASRELDCPDLGLRLAGYQDLTGLGPLAIAIRH